MSPQVTTVAIIFTIIIVENDALHPLSDAFIDHINAMNITWKAGRNFHSETPLFYIKKLLGAKIGLSGTPKAQEDQDTGDLPDDFDAREKWKNCPSLNEIRDQGQCGNGWAIAAVEVMTDRYCIYSEGKKQFHFSAEHMTGCSYNGCQGGYPADAFFWWIVHGLVSGGNYGSGEGCRPYTIEHCDHTGQDKSKPCQPYDGPPSCFGHCQSNYTVSFEDDLKRGKGVYYNQGESKIMADIYHRGPVTATFVVYEDFITYKSGVYQHVTGEMLYGHAVKILGWGVENGVKYWLGANSWGPDFGEGGYFKFLRGSDHCAIESHVVAGEPIIDY